MYTKGRKSSFTQKYMQIFATCIKMFCYFCHIETSEPRITEMKTSFSISILLLLLALLITTDIRADLTFTQYNKGGFPIVGTSAHAVMVIDKNDAEVVNTVAKCVIQDIETVTGKRLTLSHQLENDDHLPIIAGTIGQSQLLDKLIQQGTVDTTGVTGRWEAYTLQLVTHPTPKLKQALVIMGGTPRGTAYGLFEISRRIGVSPYTWWADVVPAPMSTIYVEGDRTRTEAPSVKYRGLFINDEDWALYPWAKNTIDAACNNIGPRTYEKVMELLLRLRANCLWPAKHHKSRAFWSMEENKQLAKIWDIIMSTGDSMMRDNLYEWPRFIGATGSLGSDRFSFAYNAEQVSDYWAKRAGEAKDYECIYDLGMRGLQDVALIGYEGQAAQLQGLKDIIAEQRRIITDSLGGDPTKIPQIYIPYKEALTLYNAGLQIPEDVTLCWVDDNYAYIRQLPTASEQKRSGGNGIYYHLSYLGNPCSYIWLSTISPSLVSYELCKAYENGMQQFWMINVGDIKPAEVEFEFCMELAWDVTAWTPERAWEFSRWWAAKTFGEDLADELGEIRLEHYRLAAQSKPETIREVTFSIQEMEQRIRDYQALETRVSALESSIPTRLQDAYFQLFTYPIMATANQNYKLLGSKLSYWYAGLGNHPQAMAYAAMARAGYSDIVHLTNKFNKEIAGGKWNGIMSMTPNTSSTGSQFGMPFVANINDSNPVKGEMLQDDVQHINILNYTASRGEWKMLRNLGVGDNSLAVLPIDYTTYTTTTCRTKGPYLEYSVPLKKGTYQIIVRCLPTFPITTSNDLNVGMATGGGAVTVKSIKCNAETNIWSDNVMHGYAEARFSYNALMEKEYKLRFYAMNPALVISDIVFRQTDAEDLELTNQLLVNSDFEWYKSGTSIMRNTDGTIRRGVPYGWTLQGSMSGNSYGISGDNSINYNDGGNICWFKAKPMPVDFQLSQTIPAEKLTPGVYEVGCMLWNQSGKRGTCRLFANDHVQYYAHKADYDKILRQDEFCSFAGHKAGYETHTILHPMRVVLNVKEGEDLTVGIRTSNSNNDGAQTDETGWFKVDHFTIRRLGDIDDQDPDALTKELLVNHDFEYQDATTLANGNRITGIPYGWHVKCSDAYSYTTSGIYGNGDGMHGKNYCAFTSTGLQPMPTDLTLYQTIPSDRVQPGIYRVSCLFWSEKGREGMGRLFANNEVQYYATKYDYLQNLTDGEHATFAAYDNASTTVTTMQEMCVYVTVQEGDDLTVGIRSGGMKSDGSMAMGTDRTGKFRVDYFRIEKVGDLDPDGISAVSERTASLPFQKASSAAYDLTGRPVNTHSLTKGIYIIRGKKMVIR